jgi:lipoprotein signal peptidase
VFVLFGVVGGLLLGLLLGGRLGRLGAIRFEWAGLVLVGMLVQTALFSDLVAERIGTLGPPIYVVSTALVLIAVLRNLRIAGLPVVAAGAASNLAAIVANGGYMPVSAAALGVHAGTPATTYSNSIEMANPVLAPLTDIFALPSWLPGANVFSIGDVAIVVGIALAIVLQMRTREVIRIDDRMVRFGPLAEANPPGPGQRRWAP